MEHRFLVDTAEARRFLDTVRPHLPFCLRDPDQPIEFVRTTYFDTDELTLFRSHSRGSARRVRIRQYASAPDHRTPPRLGGTCAFEVKESTLLGRRKARLVGLPEDIARILAGRDGGVARRAPPLLDAAARSIELELMRPRLTTWFRRLTFEAKGLRVTLDQATEFARPTELGKAGQLAAPLWVVGRGPPLVLEVKLRVEPPVWLWTAMRRLSVGTQFSKFRDGLLAMQRAEHRQLARGSQPNIKNPGER